MNSSPFKLFHLLLILCLVFDFSYLAAQTISNQYEDLYRNVTVTRWADPDGSKPTPYQQWKDQISVTPFKSNRVYQSLLSTQDRVMVIVNSAIHPSILGQINQYIADLESQNYEVILVTTSGGTPQDIRSLLQGEANLFGAILVGDLPIPWFQIIESWDGNITFEYEEFPCDLYYMDLNGTWIDTKHYDAASMSFVAGADGLFESHTGSVEPEIWVGRLTASTLTSGNEIDLLRNYFDKNHQYRSAQTAINNRAITYIDDDWSYWTTCGLEAVYSDVTVVNDKEITRGTDYKNRLDDNYLWIHVCAHSWPGGHSFKYNNGNNTDWVYVNDIITIDPVAHFYNLYACSNARYVEANYMGGWYIFVDSYGLGAVGSTKTGGMLIFEEFYDPMADGATLGDAFKHWINQRAIGGFDDFEKRWYYGMTLLGDPALTCATPYTLPELVGQSISFSPGSTTPGADVSFTSTIQNQGNVAAGAFHINYYLSDDNTTFDFGNADFLGSDMIPSINPLSSESSTTTLQIPPDVVEGDYYVWIVIDPLHAVTEAYEYNNKLCSGTTLSVTSGYTIFDDFEDGIADGWIPKIPSRWSVVFDEGDYSYFLNTSNYTNDERSIIAGYEFFDFDLKVKIKSPENLSANPGANYVIWFGFRDEDNYYYLRFDHLTYENKLFRHYQGGNTVIASYNGMTVNDNSYHLIGVSRSGSQINVYFDVALVMSVNDNYLPAGKIAIGSFNDAAYFDDVGIIGGSPTYIDVTFPIGGETFEVGSPYNITWNASVSISRVKIDVSTDGGSNWSVLTSGTDNDGSWTWIPQTQHKSTNCHIRISDSLDVSTYDISNTFQVSDAGVYTAIQVPVAMPVPILDGILDDPIWIYADTDSLLFGDTENWGQPWTNFADNLVLWRAVWSPATNRLYVAVEVIDDSTGTFDDNDPNDPNYYPWNDESIEFYTDGDNSGGGYTNRYDIAQQWRVSGENNRNLNNFPSSSYNSIYTGNDFITMVKQGSKGNWICEAEFTIYNVLPAQPKLLTEGDIIGWEIWYNDCDDETWENGHYVRDQQTGWKYLGPAYVNADYFGDLLIGPLPHDSIMVTINQIDATGFPTINSYVSIYDLAGNSIAGLNETNFLVKEDGVRELPITVVPYGGAQQVNVAMAMDYSGSMSNQAIADMETAAHTFVNLMEPNDEGAIFKFASYVQKMIGFTPDKNALHNAISQGFPGAGGYTALFDAIYDAVTEAIGKSGRKAVLALTDGADTRSSHTIEQTIAHANQYSTPVFTIGLGSSVNENVLKRIANETGGEYYRAPTSSELEEIYKKISEYLKNQYLVTYTTHNPQRDGTWRNVYIEVTYLNAAGSDTAGYLAPTTDSLDIWIAKTHQSPSGAIISIPAKIGDIANKEIFSVGLQVSYNPQVLQAIHANTSGTVTQNWGAPTYEITSGKIKIGMAGFEALPDSGSLVNIVFNILGSEGQTTVLHFDDALLNEGIPPARTDDGFFRVITQNLISGKMGYYSDFSSKPVPGTIVQLTDGTVAKDTTDNSGYYEFLNLCQLNYTVKPYHDGDLGNAISPLDASYILQYYVGLRTLTPYQKIAADVSGSGTITTWDASQVLRFYVGDIPEFEIGDDWKFVPASYQINHSNWSSAPDSLKYNPLTQQETGQDYYGIIYGDVTGNWTFPTATLHKDEMDGMISSLSNTEPIYGLPGSTIEIPFQFHNLNSTCSFGAMLEFNQKVFRFKEIVPTETTQKWTISARQHGDTLKFALAGAEGINGNAVLATVRFEISPDVNPGEYHELLIHRLSLNEIEQISAPARIQYIAKSLIPASFRLLQNHPNPFNASTEIRFELPEPGQVKMKIYNLQGQEVRTLLNEQREAGYHSCYFDGRNNQGQYLTSGVYIFTLEANSNIATKKMILIR